MKHCHLGAGVSDAAKGSAARGGREGKKGLLMLPPRGSVIAAFEFGEVSCNELWDSSVSDEGIVIALLVTGTLSNLSCVPLSGPPSEMSLEELIGK